MIVTGQLPSREPPFQKWRGVLKIHTPVSIKRPFVLSPLEKEKEKIPQSLWVLDLKPFLAGPRLRLSIRGAQHCACMEYSDPYGAHPRLRAGPTS